MIQFVTLEKGAERGLGKSSVMVLLPECIVLLDHTLNCFNCAVPEMKFRVASVCSNMFGPTFSCNEIDGWFSIICLDRVTGQFMDAKEQSRKK